MRTLVRLFKSLATPDYVQMVQCLIFLEEPQPVADILQKLSKGNSQESLMANQIAFDMYESASQQFLARVLSAIPEATKVATPAPEKEATERLRVLKLRK